MPVAVLVVYVALGAVAASTLVTRMRASRRHIQPGRAGIQASLGPLHLSEDRLAARRRLAARVAVPTAILAVGAAAGVAAGAGAAAWILGALAGGLLMTGVVTVIGPQPALHVHTGGVHLGRFGPGRREIDALALVIPFSDVLAVEVVRGEEECRAVRDRMRAAAPLRPAGGRGARMRPLGDLYGDGMGAALHLWLAPGRVPEVPCKEIPGRGRSTNTLCLYWSGPEILIGVRDPERLEQILGRLAPAAA